MKVRSSRISASIAKAIATAPRPKSFSRDFFEALLAFFTFFKLHLTRYRADDFHTLRHDVWKLDEEEYSHSFEESSQANSRKGKENESELVPVGDLGYSGSTFFTTPNSKYLVKSLPRRFEHEFFTHDLLDEYAAHMKSRPASLLVRITDMVYTAHATLGGILGTAPTHHVVMENLLYGKQLEEDEDTKNSWQTYDLKPQDYFYPERDIAYGTFAPDSVIDKLTDEFPDKVNVSTQMKAELLELIDADTQLLADSLAVDYSLFLVRFPGPSSSHNRRPVPFVGGAASPWRTGVDDVDGKWTYRAVVLDFFWAKHKFQAKAMTGLVNTYNVVADQGPMSITTTPTEYRERFLKMVNSLVNGQDI